MKKGNTVTKAPSEPAIDKTWQKRDDAALIMRHAELVQDRGRYRQAMSHIKQAVKVNDKKK